MIDPIADLFNRIMNAQAVMHPTVEIPFSKINYEISKILEKEKFIEKTEKSAKKDQEKKVNLLKITLRYDNKVPAITGVKRVSKPGQRIYTGVKELRPIKNNMGISILSTPKGLMTNKTAKKSNQGGEMIAQIW